jgi:ABC-type uncharacterized transport system fused permease/ATPase subunit
MSTVTIALYVFLGNSLDIGTAYTVKLVFTYVQTPLRVLPFLIAAFFEFRISMRRIQEFLECDEINKSIVNHNGSILDEC